MVLSYSPDRALVCGQVLGLSAFTVPLLPEPLVALVLFVLTNKIPGLISGIITGASVGGNGIGAFGAGAAVGAVGMAAAAAATGGAAFAAGAANISGGAQALMAAFKGAQSNVAAGSDITSRLAGAMGGGGDSGGGGGGSDSGGGSPLASAMGLNSSTSSASSSSSSIGESYSSQASSSSSEGGNSGGAASGSDGGSAQSTSADSSSGGSDSSQPASSSSKLATAGKIAADMGANLAAGMGRSAANKAAGIADSAKARIADTAGGRLAQEISNPGAASQERRDNQDIAKAESIMSQQDRTEKAEEAREFLAQQSAPSFEGDSIGSAGSNSDVNAEEEIAAFRDRNQNA